MRFSRFGILAVAAVLFLSFAFRPKPQGAVTVSQSDQTAPADRIVQALLKQGYRFVTVPQLLEISARERAQARAAAARQQGEPVSGAEV